MVRHIKIIQGCLALTAAFLLGYLLAPTTRVVNFPSFDQPVRRQQSTPIKGNLKVVSTSATEGKVKSQDSQLLQADWDHRSHSNQTADQDTVQHDNKNSSIPTLQYIDVDVEMPDIDSLYEKLVVVTAFSQNHFKEALGIIGTSQHMMPDKKIIVYDLGIEVKTKQIVKSFCNVELRPFPFKDYPNFVKNLLVYSWKPIIINMTLNEFGAIYWGDAGVRFKKSLKQLLPYTRNHHGYMALMHSFDPKVKSKIKHQYFYTHPLMFSYLGINRTEYYEEQNASPHPTANRQLFINSTTLQTKIVRPLVKCALDLDCIKPKGARKGQHRFDASALTLLIYKNMKYEWTPSNNDNNIFNDVITIERSSGEKYKPKQCT